MISRIFRTVAPLVAGLAGLSPLAPYPLQAQVAQSLVTNRLTSPIDENSLVTLKGTVHPLANKANDRGAAPDSMPLERLQIVLKRSDAQESALKQLIQDEHRPGSASYHKWLTPAQFGQQFGPSDQDVATLESWLASKGFNIQKVNPGRQTLEISGNVAQFRSAFHAQIHQYAVNGETHYANATDPQIPSALAPVFGGFVSLNNFRPRPLTHVLGQASYNVKTGQTKPQWTYGNSSGVSFALAPSDFAVQYDLPSNLDGSGQTIAVINETNINVGLVNQFRTLFGLPNNPPQVIIDGNDPGIDGINDPDGPNYASVEAYLDVEWAGAVAPKATVDLVIGADTALESGLILAAEHAVYQNLAPVMTLSFGLGCEAQLGSGNQFVDGLWEQAAAQGITVLVAAGDSGSAGCDNDTTQDYAVGGAAVSGLASTPYNVAVGGTDFYYSSWNQGSTAIDNQIASYWNTTPSQSPSTSIKGVIPEQPWNDSQYGLNLFSIYTDSGDTQTSIAAGSGGASRCISGTAGSNGSFSSCTGGYAKPAWQSGAGVPPDKVRDIPDVSLFAANGLNVSFYPICYVDGDCQPPSGSNLVQITGVGGTSASSPAFAGIMALVNEKYGRQGQADYVLYPLATQYPSAFHDVTHGTNTVPCAYSSFASNDTPNCIAVSNPLTVNDPNFGQATEGEIGSGTTADYNATAGYDLAAGLGSVDAAKLIDDWGSVTFAGSSVSLTSPTAGASFTHGQSVTFTGAVTATGGSTPTGDVAIETDSTEPTMQAIGYATLSGGSFSTSTTTLPGGTYNVWANYAGDTLNASAQSQKTQITVSPESSGIYFNIDNVGTPYGGGSAVGSGITSVSYGTQLILSAQITPGSQLAAFESCQTNGTTCPTYTVPTGTVVFKDNGTALNTAVVNAEGDAEYNAALIPGSHSVTANYSGDDSYNASSASAINFSVIKNTPLINVYSSVVTSFLPSNQADVLTIQVLNSANQANENALGLPFSNAAAAPTGTVTISGMPSGVPGSATLVAGVDYITSSPAGIATITIPASTPAGNYNVTVTYNGDANYATATQTGTVPISSAGGVASTTAATISGSISPTTTVTISGTVTGKSGYPAPTNANGGVYIYAAGYYLAQLPLTAGSGDTSSFSGTFTSQSLLQGTNPITVQFAGDNTYAPSSVTVSPAISNPLSDFSMVPDSTLVAVTAGTAATDTIQLAPVNGFSGSVAFTCKAPAGITCSLSPTSYAFSGGTSTATLTLNASSSAINGVNNVLITGIDSSGKFVHTLGIQADVTGAATASAAFTLSASPSTITIAPGSTSTASAVTVTPSNGFSGNVDLTATVTGPGGATSIPTVTFNPTPLDITGQNALGSSISVATTSSTTVGNYTVTVTGTSGSTTSMATLNVVVSSSVASNFALAANPASVTLSAGATTGNTTSISVTPAGGFTGTVNLACAVTTSPSGAVDSPTCTAPAANVTGTAAVSSTLTINTTARTSGALRNPLDKLFAAGGGLVVAGLLFFGIPARRRSWRSILAVLALVGVVGLGIGCGSSGGSGGGGGGGGTTGTSAGAYVLTVTGTDAATGQITATTTVSLTVN